MIHDVLIEELDWTDTGPGSALTALLYSEPRLHRIGMIQVVRLPPEARSDFRRRERADELWVLVEGRAWFHWFDQREGSPTFGNHQEHAAESPTRVMVPFGVGFGVFTDDQPARLLRLATEEHQDDAHVLDWPTR